VLRFNADLFIAVFAKLNMASQLVDGLIKAELDGVPWPSQMKEAFESFSQEMQNVSKALDLMGLPMSLISSDRLVQLIANEKQPILTELRKGIDELNQRIADELKGKWAFMILHGR